MSDIVVIIPMYGFSELTDKCVALTMQNAGVEVDILVVDDGSQIPYRNQDADYVLRLDENTGFTNAINQGILYAMRENPYLKYIHLLNNDTEPEPDFIKYLVDAMNTYKDIAIAASTKILEREPLLIENAAIDLLFGWHCFTDYHLSEEIKDITFTGFTSVLLRVDAIQEIGLLDKRMRNYCSDNDYCFRAIQNGYKVVVVPKSRVFHERETTTRANGVQTGSDQKILFDKLSGVDIQKVLDRLPLDHTEDSNRQNYGRLKLEIYEK